MSLPCSPQLERLTYTADSPGALHAVVTALPALPRLTSLSLIARSFSIPPETARLIGRLPLTSLRLDSAVSCPAALLSMGHAAPSLQSRALHCWGCLCM